MESIEFLRQFSPVSDADLAMLQTELKPKSFARNTILTAPGDIQKELYFVQSGIQMSYFESEQKTHVIAFTYPPGLCAIPGSFSFQKPSEYHLQCLTNSEFLAIGHGSLVALFDRSQALERLFRKMTELILDGMISRHIELHSMSIEERFLAFTSRSAHLLPLVPHKYLASYLGIDPTNFSKLYNSVKIG
jgi:CRP-like cAMP-binding protein